MYFQFFINGLIAGSIYVLVATGFSLIYSTNRFPHFAHGTVIALGAYLLFYLSVSLGVNFFLGAIAEILAAGFLGWLLYKIVYQPLSGRKASSATLLVSSIGLMIFLENMLLLLFGPSVRSFKILEGSRGIELAGAVITPLQIIIIISALLLSLGLGILLRFSRLGQSLRAVADNPELASIAGINKESVAGKSFILGSAIAGVAAILIALEENLSPFMGTALVIKGFTAAIIGGVLSLPGAVLGSYVLGLAENFGIIFLPSGFKDAIAFLLLFFFLLFFPTGILGFKKGPRL